MKTTIEFNMDDPDDEQKFRQCMKAKEMALMIDQYVNGNGLCPPEFLCLLKEYNIDLNELID